jgi:RNA polymerase sigma factor (sigma-70 family)
MSVNGYMTRRDCAEDHIGLAKYFAKRFAKQYPRIGLDEFISAGYMGLVQAEDRFDSARGVKFGTFAARRVQGECLNLVRTVGRHGGWSRYAHEQRVTVCSIDDVTQNQMERYAQAPPSVDLEAMARRQRCRAILRSQPPRMRRVLQLVAAGWQQKDIAADIGVAPSRITQLMNSVRAQVAA